MQTSAVILEALTLVWVLSVAKQSPQRRFFNRRAPGAHLPNAAIRPFGSCESPVRRRTEVPIKARTNVFLRTRRAPALLLVGGKKDPR